jgi:hypothetical protein
MMSSIWIQKDKPEASTRFHAWCNLLDHIHIPLHITELSHVVLACTHLWDCKDLLIANLKKRENKTTKKRIVERQGWKVQREPTVTLVVHISDAFAFQIEPTSWEQPIIIPTTSPFIHTVHGQVLCEHRLAEKNTRLDKLTSASPLDSSPNATRYNIHLKSSEFCDSLTVHVTEFERDACLDVKAKLNIGLWCLKWHVPVHKPGL